MMFKDEISNHNILFSGASLEIGRIHWYILKAYTELEKQRFIKEGDIRDAWKSTALDDEIASDEIHWWVFEKEKNINELNKRTKDTLNSVQKLKENSSSLIKRHECESYAELIGKIKEFTEKNEKNIQILHNYVCWLYSQNSISPCVLFTYRVWGSTRLSDRIIKIAERIIDEAESEVRACTEIALGLRCPDIYLIEDIFLDKYSEYMEEHPKYKPPTELPKNILNISSYNILSGLADYFEFIRQSLRNLILEIEKYHAPENLKHKESFWISVIEKFMDNRRIENQLWDFKETFEMWQVKEPKEKAKFEIKFCEQIAAYANADGGVLIVGITDEPPREIVGIQDLENKLKHTKSVIKRYIDHDHDFFQLQQVSIKDKYNRHRNCLIIAIAQTKNVITVKDDQDKFSYPVRSATGLERVTNDSIKKRKESVLQDNYGFITIINGKLRDIDN